MITKKTSKKIVPKTIHRKLKIEQLFKIRTIQDFGLGWFGQISLHNHFPHLKFICIQYKGMAWMERIGIGSF